jgi:signal transduction histidine kinase
MSRRPAASSSVTQDAGRAVVLFGALVIALLWAGLAWHLDLDRRYIVRSAQTDVANLARLLDVHIQRTLAGLDQHLLFLKAEYQRAPERFTLASSLAHSAAVPGLSVKTVLVDERGIVVDSTVPGFARTDLSDRDFIKAHQAFNSGLFVGKPVSGRVSGKWTIELSRRLERPDGGLAGILVVSLDPTYLTDIYRSVDVGLHGSVALVGRDGVVRAAIASDVILIGDAVTDAAVLEHIFTTRDGSQRMDGLLGAEPRLTSFRTLPDLPLALVVGRAERDVLALHGETLVRDGLIGLAVTLLVVVGLVQVYRLVHRQELTARALAAKKSELTASRERLKRYVTDLERIAEVAAHDLQEPLRRVVAYTQLLAKHVESALDAEGRDYVAQVVAGAQRMRKLVRDLESYVAVDHLPEINSVTPATEAVMAATERLAEPIRTVGATIRVDHLPEVAADDRSLTEVFSQLIDNAIRYRDPDRKAMIDISARCDGHNAQFAVRDNGIGIEEPSRARLFEIFHRLRGIDGQDGTGIGLAMVRRIIERLGGRIWVESFPGTGSTFFFTVPLLPRAAQTGPEVQAA